MQLFISRGRTIAIYPGYKVDLNKFTNEMFTGRIRITGTWIFEVDYINGKPICAIAVDPKGNYIYGDEALMNLEREYDRERDKYFVEVIQLTQDQITIDCEYFPQAAIKYWERPSLEEAPKEEVPKETMRTTEEAKPVRVEEIEEAPAIVEKTLEKPSELAFEKLDILELASIILNSNYVGEVEGSIRKIIEQYGTPVYLSCTSSNKIIRIVVDEKTIKASEPVNLDDIIRCRVFIVRKESK